MQAEHAADTERTLSAEGMSGPKYDAVVVGSGPNGLAAGIELARAGASVLIIEAEETIGGGTRTRELTLPGYAHDVCSAVHPLILASPFVRKLPLDEYGLELIQPRAPLAHPLDGGRVAMLYRSLDQTAESLEDDGASYRKLLQPTVDGWEKISPGVLGPLRIPRHPIRLALFGLRSINSATALIDNRFRGDKARAMIAGIAAHSMLRLDERPTGGFGILLAALAHAFGWPVVKGGSNEISKALAAHFQSLGGTIATGWTVKSLDELPPHKALLFDLTPAQLLRIAGDRLSSSYRSRLKRFRYGPGVFKIDWALDGPVPWAAAECSDAGTVHAAGTAEEVAAAEAAVAIGAHPERPFVLAAQPSLFDSTRAPEGKHTLWAYCHVPHGSTVDMTQAIEDQFERFAPGFRDLVLERHTFNAAQMESYNANYVGGDINGGRQDMRQLFTRPVWRLNPYTTGAKDIYICSSSTPPGGGVHGMCGYWAARAALRRSLRDLRRAPSRRA
ncbi:MAG TPA: NAD(P)/FAD-dependent oxidoreductase [Actinomycetota bacterium]|jgi:phytoene dehydrogenase-like protein|nr:NAD(P)/FAD-dependent oxidoreductase [Actinomycetota bacterium]